MKNQNKAIAIVIVLLIILGAYFIWKASQNTKPVTGPNGMLITTNGSKAPKLGDRLFASAPIDVYKDYSDLGSFLYTVPKGGYIGTLASGVNNFWAVETTETCNNDVTDPLYDPATSAYSCPKTRFIANDAPVYVA